MGYEKKLNSSEGTQLLRFAAMVVIAAILLVLLSQTVFAKTTYVISDGNRVFTYESYATDPAAVLAEAGLSLEESDTYTAEAGAGNTALTV